MPAPTNPFPGMNPYLQADWSDVHNSLITYIREALSFELPDDLLVRSEQYVAVEGEDGEPQAYRPDVKISETWQRGFPPVWQPENAEGGALAVAEPLVFLDEPETERWIEIRDLHGRLITVIEVLSPTNKHENGWMKYHRKQRDFIAGGVNLVEIDLLRGGSHVTAINPGRLTLPPGTCHHVCVSRPTVPGRARREVYLCPLREPLPTIRVPLRLSDPDVPLALQPLIDRCYQTGRYWLADYTRDAAVFVAPEDIGWVGERLRAAGLRS